MSTYQSFQVEKKVTMVTKHSNCNARLTRICGKLLRPLLSSIPGLLVCSFAAVGGLCEWISFWAECRKHDLQHGSFCCPFKNHWTCLSGTTHHCEISPVLAFWCFSYDLCTSCIPGITGHLVATCCFPVTLCALKLCHPWENSLKYHERLDNNFPDLLHVILFFDFSF